jgi:hypothetical protein
LNRIESVHHHPIPEIVREYGGMDAAGGVFPNYPTMSSRYGDFARDAHNQQSSSAYSQRRNMHDYDCCSIVLSLHVVALLASYIYRLSGMREFISVAFNIRIDKNIDLLLQKKNS